MAVNLNNTNANSALNFINCLGGSGSSGFNFGVNFGAALSLVNGTLISLIAWEELDLGGSNIGVQFGPFTVTAPVIIATDSFGRKWGLCRVGYRIL